MLDFDLRKAFDGYALELSARVGPEWLVLLAPSGGGKSLTLNLLAGIVRPDAGRVTLDGQTLYDGAHGVNLPMRRRRIGYVFQDFALFPHMTVARNIAYGLPAGVSPEQDVARWLAFFHLEGREAAWPRELSGGQRQRVALARALACRPRLLLLDEPLSALDRPIRLSLQTELARLKAELSIPVVLVTHDFGEAQVLGDRVAVLAQGRLLETGPRDELFARPRRHETARFLGVENVWPARVVGGAGDALRVEAGGLTARVAAQPGVGPGSARFLCIRAADVRLVTDEKPRPNAMEATVAAITPEGAMSRLMLQPQAAGAPALVTLLDDYVRGRYGIEVGSPVRVWLPPEKLLLCE